MEVLIISFIGFGIGNVTVLILWIAVMMNFFIIRYINFITIIIGRAASASAATVIAAAGTVVVVFVLTVSGGTAFTVVSAFGISAFGTAACIGNAALVISRTLFTGNRHRREHENYKKYRKIPA